MKQKLIEHLGSIVFVGIVILLAAWMLRPSGNKIISPNDLISTLDSIESLRPDRPMHRAILKESLKAFYAAQDADSVIAALTEWRRNAVLAEIEASRQPLGLSFEKLYELAPMVFSFVVVFFIVTAFIYYGAQTMGTFLYVRTKQNRPPDSPIFWSGLRRIFQKRATSDVRTAAAKQVTGICVKIIVKSIAYGVMFSPAYVIAYSFKTNFETNSVLFLILLGIFTNGVLISYTYKFYSLLTSESRKGYVETALVKNLAANYYSVGLRELLAPVKQFPNHVLQHIFVNARFQYLSAVREQASFIITGLIIIEMALNIQGHLGYELLKSILYHNWEVVVTIVFTIFLLVKLTEIIADVWFFSENARYENRNNE